MINKHTPPSWYMYPCTYVAYYRPDACNSTAIFTSASELSPVSDVKRPCGLNFPGLFSLLLDTYEQNMEIENQLINTARIKNEEAVKKESGIIILPNEIIAAAGKKTTRVK